MGKRSLYIGKIAMAALLCTTLAVPQAFAVTAAEKKAEADAITEQIDAMQTGLNEMKKLYEKASAEHAEAVVLRDEAAAKVEEETARVEALQDQMSSFAVSMYKDGGAASFLGVLLQTTSFHEFMTSWDRCTAISDTGKQILADEKAAREELEAARTTYETQAARAERQMAIAESSTKQIEETQADLREQVAKLTEEAEKLEEQEKAKDKGKESELTAEEARKAEEERKAKEAEIEERAKQAAAAAAAAAASAHAEASAAVLMGEGFFTNPCPTATESSGFGYRDFDNSFHKGLDMAAPQGTPYFAADDGVVLYATNDGGYNGGAGNWVVISHGNGIVTKYMHSLTTFVKPGDQVTRGQNIGLVGSTGQSTGPHLHFQVEVDGVAVNPLNYI